MHSQIRAAIHRIQRRGHRIAVDLSAVPGTDLARLVNQVVYACHSRCIESQ